MDRFRTVRASSAPEFTLQLARACFAVLAARQTDPREHKGLMVVCGGEGRSSGADTLHL